MELPMTVRVIVLAAASTLPSSYYQSNLVLMRHCCRIQCITLGQTGSLILACWTSESTDTVACWWLSWKTALMKSLTTVMHTSFAGFYNEHIATSLVNFYITQNVNMGSSWSDEMTCKPSHNESHKQSPHQTFACVQSLMASSSQLRSSIQTWLTLFIQTYYCTDRLQRSAFTAQSQSLFERRAAWVMKELI